MSDDTGELFAQDQTGAEIPRRTMREAHEAIAGRASAIGEVVLAAIEKAGERGMTREEAERATGLRPNTVSARLAELTKAGRLKIAGTRPLASGRNGAVWVEAKAHEESIPPMFREPVETAEPDSGADLRKVETTKETP